MSTFGFLFFFTTIVSIALTSAQPSPGYYPSSNVPTIDFDHEYQNLWGSQHQTLNQGELTIWLDRYSGSGFKSLTSYNSGYFGAKIKLHPGYTAGVITCLYLSNAEDFPGKHDEIDIEFLGTTTDKPYVLQTNVFIRGSGDVNIIGRENQIHLWFDPTQDFHHYAILWNPNEIIFFVDDVPIRRYPKKDEWTFPNRPLWVYGSIWDASSWATEHGKYKADYKYEPFYGRYREFKIGGCPINGADSCRAPWGTQSGPIGLSPEQYASMNWVQSNYLVYDYCHDPTRDRRPLPEC
ncbi:xyloglucan endotransglucosylase/hydrolase protein 31-like [Impatiens glandulifera]|uniref:xyloglucan endotransglucosylase/hydrolase protein 31-like n=1 Tax=Impatiens glandulifera TaxID=253017 RepID=UPI001FB16F86|nr:xyloglucan endotransglucosylase/hydrolase protein 31-like [Impatiens glandulifera]